MRKKEAAAKRADQQRARGTQPLLTRTIATSLAEDKRPRDDDDHSRAHKRKK